ncbi:hypothetical protein EDD85DRAFT_783355 [Armillaria nabsnona]|nr:hypothetical protein EDD85DRAFT_783355 [Armillaria nabsnona]
MYPVHEMSGKVLIGGHVRGLIHVLPPSSTIAMISFFRVVLALDQAHRHDGCDRREDHAHTLGLPLPISTSTARTPSTPVNFPLPRLGLRNDFAAIWEPDDNGRCCKIWRKRGTTPRRDERWHWDGVVAATDLETADESMAGYHRQRLECYRAWPGKTGTKTTSPDGRDGYPFRKIEVGVAAVSEPNAILRADVIPYFVLYHYGGVYYDVDIGCKRPLDPLLTYPVILPKTIPLIHNLATFDHSWFLNYPTVMFSTGPMFLSIQYAIWTSSHAATLNDPIHILPKSLYGKNAKDGKAPHSFFSHFYGGSRHADDAAFIGFLGHWGNKLMLATVLVLIAGLTAQAGYALDEQTLYVGCMTLCWVTEQNDRQCGVLFFLPVSIQPHDIEVNPSLEEMRLEKRWHVQDPEDYGPGEYCDTSSSSHLHDIQNS